MATAPPSRPVTRFGRYTLIDRLAVGGMAEIFLARQAGPQGFAKTVVLKRIRPHLARQESFVRMFLDEARLAAQLSHPSIVQIHDLGRVGDSYFIAMEYLFGRDMRRIVPRAESVGITFPLVYALKIASQACEGLYHAHNKEDLWGAPLNIVHRDISPENIFVSFDGTVKVLDFGIAKASTQLEQTRAGELKGKLSYMSPEQVSGKALDLRSDLFSLGVTLYEWLTGFKLFAGEGDAATLRNILEARIYAPSYFRSDIPAEVDAIVLRALERDRERRYQSAWELQYDVDQFLARHEFSPSNIHLSNFLKQLFHEDMQAERDRLAAVRLPDDEPPAEDTPAPAAATGSPGAVTVQLPPDEARRLAEVARRHGLTVPALAQDVLLGFLKYR